MDSKEIIPDSIWIKDSNPRLLDELSTALTHEWLMKRRDEPFRWYRVALRLYGKIKEPLYKTNHLLHIINQFEEAAEWLRSDYRADIYLSEEEFTHKFNAMAYQLNKMMLIRKAYWKVFQEGIERARKKNAH